MQTVTCKNISIGGKNPLAFFLGPCVIEGEKESLYAAEFLVKLSQDLDFPLIFKSSYDKANRSSIDSYRGPGLKKGLHILQKIKEEFKVPIVTDVHSPEEAKYAAEVCDILQIPAFLCRQTDLLVACAQTQRVVKVKKGQFLAPWDMEQVIQKILFEKNNQIILTERGSCFGYNNLVADMRSIPIMQKLGYPVCFDATHSVQLPGKNKKESGGDKEMAGYLAKAAIATGANALFLETHPDPEKAYSDKKTQIPFKELPKLLEECIRLHQASINAL